jgi:signal transduction histidine kinase
VKFPASARYVLLALVLSVAVSFVMVSASSLVLLPKFGNLVGTLAEGIADIVAHGIAESTVEGELQRVRRLQSHLGQSIPLGVWVLDSGGKVVASSAEDAAPRIDGLPAIRKPNGAEIFHTHPVQWVVRLPLGKDTGLKFMLRLGPDRIERGEGIRWMAAYALLLLICSVSSSCALLFQVFRLKSREAREVLSSLARGNLRARMRVGRPEEVGQLMAAFNEMADRIETLVKNLERSEETRKKLVAELGHDFRTPLTAVKVALENLQHLGAELNAERKARLIGVAVKELAYMERLLQFLFTLVRAGEPHLEVHPSPLDLSELVQEELHSRLALEEGKKDRKTWHWNASPEECLVTADKQLTLRLLRNLLDNARRYSRKRIDVGVEREKDRVVLVLKDDGPGLSHDIFAHTGPGRLPEMGSEAAALATTSLGLGSSIVRAIADLHEWEVSVSASPDGTEIRISCPLVKRLALSTAA